MDNEAVNVFSEQVNSNDLVPRKKLDLSKLLFFIGIPLVLFPIIFNAIYPGCPVSYLSRILYLPEGAGAIIQWVLSLLGTFFLVNFFLSKVTNVGIKVFLFIVLMIVLCFGEFYIYVWQTFPKCFVF